MNQVKRTKALFCLSVVSIGVEYYTLDNNDGDFAIEPGELWDGCVTNTERGWLIDSSTPKILCP